MSKGSKIQRYNSLLSPFKNSGDKLINMTPKEAEEVKRYLDDDQKRVYEGPDAPDGVYSVTTILGARDDDKEGLKYWKRNNNGEGDNADWEDILHYKQNRGTLAHYTALNRFDHVFDEGPTMWTEDEQDSKAELNQMQEDDDYIYSLVKDRGYVNDWEGYLILRDNETFKLDDILQDDLDYVQEEFDKICRERGIKASTVEQVEAMFALPPNGESGHDGYGGQADLLYTDPETGEHVVADLKTSKRVYDKHKYQIAAYAQAAKEHPELNGEEVDRAEIIRISPDEEEVQVYEMTDFEKYWDEFSELTHNV